MVTRSRNGFTLIELLVVIAIIAILAAILFPVFAKAREKARQSSCASNVKQLGLGILQYVQDYDEAYPPGAVLESSSNFWEQTSWVQEIAPYLKSLEIFHCPDDSSSLLNPPASVFGSGWAGGAISYAANGYSPATASASGGCPAWAMCGAGPMTPIDFGWDSQWHRTPSMAKIGRPSETILLAEKHSDDLVKSQTSYNAVNWRRGNMFLINNAWNWFDTDGMRIPNGAGNSSGVYPTGVDGGVSSKHTTLANFVFCDGHVKAMHPVDTDPDEVNQPSKNMWDGRRQ